MSFLLPKLSNKKEVDEAIKTVAEKVLVLRFGRDEDLVCLQLDDIVSGLFCFCRSGSGVFRMLFVFICHGVQD